MTGVAPPAQGWLARASTRSPGPGIGKTARGCSCAANLDLRWRTHYGPLNSAAAQKREWGAAFSRIGAGDSRRQDK